MRNVTTATRAVLAAAILIAAALVVTLGVKPDLRWRAAVLLDKVAGKLPDMSWSDLSWMLRPGSGVYLGALAQTPNPYQVIENPRTTPADIEAGKHLFAQQCSSCHGDEARGGPGGPSLYEHTFRYGRRPWALYRTITLGIPGTAMTGHALPHDDVWRLAAYIDNALLGASAHDTQAEPVHFQPVSADELRAAGKHPAEWLSYSGSYDGHRHSALGQIDRGTIGQLRVEWTRQLEDAPAGAESSPIVRGSIMFVTVPPNRVLALDAGSGHVLWSFTRELPQRLLACCGPNNRGVAVLGERVYVATLDAHLLALEARSGRVVWDVVVADAQHGYSITAAPLAIGDLVVTGVAGGEYATRGFIDAYDATSGKRRWRFYTVPEAGQAGSGTWSSGSQPTGGAPTWMTGAFDPDLNLIYWGTGNPHPNYQGDVRRGDNLYSNSVVALDATSGRLRWYFQFTPHDLHDWDAAQTPLLVDAEVHGTPRKLIAWPNRNGFYYLLDRVSGEYLLGAPFVHQSWADGLDERGRPRARAEAAPTRDGVLVYPSVTGGTNWWASSYDPDLGLVYVPTLERGSYFFVSPDLKEDPAGETMGSTTSMVPGEGLVTAVKALEVTTGRVRWHYDNAPRLGHGQTGGVMSTAGGLVFGSDLETFFALDAATGAELWRFEAGAQIVAAPVSYQLAGRQYVAIAAGRSILAFALPPADARAAVGKVVR
jgi:alcohol dehydrogenase (cytochrome c)